MFTLIFIGIITYPLNLLGVGIPSFLTLVTIGVRIGRCSVAPLVSVSPILDIF